MRRWQGTADIALTPLGRAQAEALGRTLAEGRLDGCDRGRGAIGMGGAGLRLEGYGGGLGVLRPHGGSLRPDLSRAGLGIELKRADSAPFAV